MSLFILVQWNSEAKKGNISMALDNFLDQWHTSGQNVINVQVTNDNVI